MYTSVRTKCHENAKKPSQRKECAARGKHQYDSDDDNVAVLLRLHVDAGHKDKAAVAPAAFACNHTTTTMTTTTKVGERQDPEMDEHG